MKTLEEIVKEELAAVEARLNKGKGTYGEPDYIRDAVWDSWLGERFALSTVLWRANEKVLSEG